MSDCRYILVEGHPMRGICDHSHYDDLAVAKEAARTMRLVDPDSHYGVLDRLTGHVVFDVVTNDNKGPG